MTVNQAANATSQTAPAPAPRLQNGRWSGYLHLLSARIKELRREPEAIFWIFVFPILLAIGLGIAFRNKPADVSRVVIISSPAAQHAMEMLKNSPQHASIRAEVLPADEALNRFRLGKYDLVVTAAPDGSVEYRYDPDRPESVLARTLVNDALQTAAGRKDAIAASARAATEPGARYIDFLIPGLLGLNLMGSGMWGVGFALVEMRQRKLLKRYLATPMRRGDFLLALSSSRIILMLAELVVLLGFGVLAFRITIAGSWATIVLISLVGALSFAALGLLTASRTQKIETANGLISVIMMPMWLFSGVFFSYERFPAAVLPIIRLLPLTALNDALRSTILEGRPLAAQGSRLLVLAVWGILSFVLALRWFRWT